MVHSVLLGDRIDTVLAALAYSSIVLLVLPVIDRALTCQERTERCWCGTQKEYSITVTKKANPETLKSTAGKQQAASRSPINLPTSLLL